MCVGFQRTVTVSLDTAQYQLDMEHMQEFKSEDVYSTFNLLMRRKPKVPWRASCFCMLWVLAIPDNHPCVAGARPRPLAAPPP